MALFTLLYPKCGYRHPLNSLKAQLTQDCNTQNFPKTWGQGPKGGMEILGNVKTRCSREIRAGSPAGGKTQPDPLLRLQEAVEVTSSLHPQLGISTGEGLANVFAIPPSPALLVNLILGALGPGLEVRKARKGDKKANT